MSKEAALKITFLSKQKQRCPVCGAQFRREEPLTGGGRLNAGPLTDELHRLYEPSAKFGEIFPLVYVPTVCPECWFASVDKDFAALPAASKTPAEAGRERRMSDTRLVFPGADFTGSRSLESGAAAHYLALRCYDLFPEKFSPAIKQGLAALRAGWLLDELDKRAPGQHYDWLAVLFKKKACFFYREAARRERSGGENLSALRNFGPDTDKNYGYEGFLYLTGLLQFRYGSRQDEADWAAALEEARRNIAKMFGFGAASKSKPSPLLEHARRFYEESGKALRGE
ncbi:MAG: DUF2225 domain-containing protein [Treponematales bacterium]